MTFWDLNVKFRFLQTYLYLREGGGREGVHFHLRIHNYSNTMKEYTINILLYSFYFHIENDS